MELQMKILTCIAERLILQKHCSYSPKVVILCKMQKFVKIFERLNSVFLHHIFEALHSSAM